MHVARDPFEAKPKNLKMYSDPQATVATWIVWKHGVQKKEAYLLKQSETGSTCGYGELGIQWQDNQSGHIVCLDLF